MAADATADRAHHRRRLAGRDPREAHRSATPLELLFDLTFVVATNGIGLIFATWWTYFAIPWADVLELHRERSFIWGYGHIVIYGSLEAIGAGIG